MPNETTGMGVVMPNVHKDNGYPWWRCIRLRRCLIKLLAGKDTVMINVAIRPREENEPMIYASEGRAFIASGNDLFYWTQAGTRLVREIRND